MGIPATAYSSPTRAAGISKRRSSPRRSSPVRSPPSTRRLRSRDRFFWYTDLDGVCRLVNHNKTIPKQLNDYAFAPSRFRCEPRPAKSTVASVWPPRQVNDLVGADSPEDYLCVGATCYSRNTCDAPDCGHTLSAWQVATSDWEDRFELRKTEHRGIGVYTRRAIRSGAILGWYAGELLPLAATHGSKSDYLMEIDIDDATTTPLEPTPSIFVDSAEKGNWTRFINHSCAADCVFRIMRVGRTIIMAVEAIRDIPKEKELTVDYGKDYYGLTTKKVCACGVSKCISLKRAKLEKAERREKLGNVKTCRRLAPPISV